LSDTIPFSLKTKGTNLFYFLWAAVFIFLLYILFTSTGTSDTGDGISHYMISRFSFKHPELFLDLWGKPLFTILSSPFSQFGLKGLTCFNILCGMLSALCAFKIAKMMQLNYSWMVLFFTLFAPVYFGVINSGLTEPLFSLILTFSILKAFQGKHLSAAFIFSLAPFVRPEANFIIPVFIFYFLVSKKFKAIPLLFAGTILFTLIGWIHFGDILWLKNNSPYSAANGTKYGEVHGELFTYVRQYAHIIGQPQAVFFIAGCAFIAVFPFIQRMQLKTDSNNEGMHVNFFKEEFVLVYGSLFACIAVHTFVWWKGIFPTLGLLRYISNVIPLATLLSLRGLNFILSYIKKDWIQDVVVIALIWFLCAVPFREYYFPFTLDSELAVVKPGADWLLQSPYAKEKIYPTHPGAILFLDLDPFDGKQMCTPAAVHADNPGNGIPSKSIVFWDAHYGAHDNNLPIKVLLESPDYTLLKKFEPKDSFNVFGDTPFEVYIFQRK